MLPPAWNVDALPATVRAAIDDARNGIGPLYAWLDANTGDLTIQRAIAVITDENCDRDLAGWIAGITMSVDHHRVIANFILQRNAHAVIPGALIAFATGVLLGAPMPKKQWRTIEQLALRCDRVPPELVEVLPIGLCHTFPMIRDVAQRLAILAGAPGIAVVEAALGDAARRVAQAGPKNSKTSTQARAHERWLREAREAFVHPRATGARVDELLERLLAAWRDTRDPALEGLVGELGARAAYLRGPVASAEPDSAWLALARLGDPSDLDRLLDATWPRSEHAVIARLAALAALPADPRVARLVDIAGARTVWTADTHAAVAAFLAPRATVKMTAPLARLAGPHATLYDDVVHAVDQLPSPGAAPPELLAEAHEALEPVRELEVLWREHDANPGDLALRAVLADALVADADPRGEVIALHLAIAAGTAEDGAQRRAQRLTAEHADTWEKVPGTAPAGVIHERGFPVSALTTLVDDELQQVLHRRAWVTLERLSLAGTGGTDISPLVRRMPNLTTLLVTSGARLDLLAASGTYPRLHTLGCDDAWLPPERAFPGLATLGTLVDAEHAHRYRQLAALGVKTLHHRAYPSDYAAHAAARAHGPARVILGAPTGWRVAVPARGNTLDVELAAYYYAPAVLDPLIALVRHGIERVRLHVPDHAAMPAMDEITEALASRGVRVEPGLPPLEKLWFV